MPVESYPGAPYGWRARIGLLQPNMVSDNNPYEFYLMAPPGVQMVLTSLGRRGIGDPLDEYRQAMAGIEEPIRRVLSRKVDCIVQAGVPPTVTAGWGFEGELRARIAKITDVPFATDIGCSIAAMHALGISRVAVLASDHMMSGLPEYLAHVGIQVVASRPVLSEGDPESEALSVPYRAAIALHRSAPAHDGIYIPGAFLPVVGVIEEMEKNLDIPVVTSAQAMMWRGLAMAGVNPALVAGFGRLFREPVPT